MFLILNKEYKEIKPMHIISNILHKVIFIYMHRRIDLNMLHNKFIFVYYIIRIGITSSASSFFRISGEQESHRLYNLLTNHFLWVLLKPWLRSDLVSRWGHPFNSGKMLHSGRGNEWWCCDYYWGC